MRPRSEWMPAAPSDRAVSPSATIDGANVPSKPSTNTGTLVLAPAGTRPRTITNAATKQVPDRAEASAKKPNAARIALEPLKCGVARSVVAIVPPPGSSDVILGEARSHVHRTIRWHLLLMGKQQGRTGGIATRLYVDLRVGGVSRHHGGKRRRVERQSTDDPN